MAKARLVERGLITVDPAVWDRDFLGRCYTLPDTLYLNPDFQVPNELIHRSAKVSHCEQGNAGTVNPYRGRKVSHDQRKNEPDPAQKWTTPSAKVSHLLNGTIKPIPEGTEEVIIRHREAAKTLWRRLGVAVRAAGLDEWPKPFHNLRATRETELMETFPPQTVCKWIGHDISVPAKHYLQVTDEHYERALHKCVQQPAATACNGGK